MMRVKSKNIHVLPTENESRIRYNSFNKVYELCKFPKYHTDIKSTHNIYITSNEEIKEGDWTLMFDDFVNLFLCDKPQQYLGIEKGHHLNKGLRKIILTTDQDLIKDGVQAIDDKFLEWFIKNPSCEEIKILRCPIEGLYTIDLRKLIPREEPKQETLEEASKKYAKGLDKYSSDDFINGARWQQERMYSEEEVLNKLTHFAVEIQRQNKEGVVPLRIKEWFERNKKNKI